MEEAKWVESWSSVPQEGVSLFGMAPLVAHPHMSAPVLLGQSPQVAERLCRVLPLITAVAHPAPGRAGVPEILTLTSFTTFLSEVFMSSLLETCSISSGGNT